MGTGSTTNQFSFRFFLWFPYWVSYWVPYWIPYWVQGQTYMISPSEMWIFLIANARYCWHPKLDSWLNTTDCVDSYHPFTLVQPIDFLHTTHTHMGISWWFLIRLRTQNPLIVAETQLCWWIPLHFVLHRSQCCVKSPLKSWVFLLKAQCFLIHTDLSW